MKRARFELVQSILHTKTVTKKLALSLLFASMCLSHALAADLMDIYRQALDADPTFKAAYSTYKANSEAIPQARAAFLPQLLATAQVSRNRQAVTAGSFSTNEPFDSQQWQLNASQAIFNYQAWNQLKQAKASVKSAHATFHDAAQDLILRTATAYFHVLFAKDTLQFAEAKQRANKRQLDQAQERFNVGVDTITSVYEAKAAYDQSIAEVISAQNNQTNQSENLRKLTNHIYEHLAPLRNSRIPLIHPEPNDANEWIAAGLQQNYKYLAAKYNFKAARDNIKAQSGGNWPTVAIEANTTDIRNSADASSNFFIPSEQRISSIALAMNFPFYQGGLVASKTRQAQYNFQVISEQLEQVYRDVTVNSQIAFNTIKDGISKVKADRQTLVSQRNSLESTEAQFQAGTRTMVDVVNAQQRLFEAQKQLAADQYNLINSILHLKYLAGSLNVTDLEEVNAWLATTRINGKLCQKTKAVDHTK